MFHVSTEIHIFALVKPTLGELLQAVQNRKHPLGGLLQAVQNRKHPLGSFLQAVIEKIIF